MQLEPYTRSGAPRHHAALATVCRGWATDIGRALAKGPLEATSRLDLGHAGIALFLSHLAAATGDPALERAAGVRLRAAANAVPTMPPMLLSGAVGVAWVLEQLGCDDNVNTATDAYVAQLLERHDFHDAWELMYGLAGIGVYLLERPESHPRTELLTWLVALLDAIAHTDRDGVHWRSTLDPTRPEGVHDLGMAHGACGVAVVLARIVAETTVATPIATRLLEGTLRAIRACRLPDGRAAFYPGCRESPEDTRLGWCHGDLAVATALAVGGEALGDPSCLREARELAVRSAVRGVRSAGVHDVGLCHGALGIALMFHRLHERLGGPELVDATLRWLAKAVQLRAPGEGIGDVRVWSAGIGQWTTEPGLVVGAAGAGLALLTLVGEADTGWDRALGLGPPTAHGGPVD